MVALALAIRTVTDRIYQKPIPFTTTVLVAVVWSIHLFLPFTEPEVSESQDQLNLVRDHISEGETQLIQLSKDFRSGTISLDQFKEGSRGIESELEKLRAQETAKSELHQVIRENARISGFPSWHKFIYNFGIALILCALYYELIKGLPYHKGPKRIEKNFKAIAYGSIVGFFLAWIFFPENDLRPWMYKVVLWILGLSISVAAFYVSKNHENRLAKMRESFLDFMVEMRNTYYKKLLKHAIRPTLFDEAGDEVRKEIQKETKEFEERLRDKAEEIHN